MQSSKQRGPRVHIQLLSIVLSIAVVSASCFVSSSVRADDDADKLGGSAGDDHARKFFEAGRSAYDIGNYAEALNDFQQAYELSDRPQLLYNIGQCADRLRLDETALAAFRRYLERVPDASNRFQVQERVRVLEQVASTKMDAASLKAVADEAGPAEAKAAPAQSSALDMSLRPQAQADSEPGLLSKWWVWAAAGGVVVVAVLGVVIASSGSETKTSERATGSNGRVIATLELGSP
jgi:tetratricopeptide (TPR) repeat protein